MTVISKSPLGRVSLLSSHRRQCLSGKKGRGIAELIITQHIIK